MANAINTKSTLTTESNLNKTSTSLSTNIIIMVGNTAVGAIQSMQIGEKRSLKMIDEVGTDGHVDSAPNQSTNISGSCQRVRFDRLRITEAFSRGFIHVASQVYPFDIIIIDRQKRSSDLFVSTVIKNVWISGLDYTYQVSDWVITDTMIWEAETIYSHIAGGKPVAQGGERGVVHMGNLNGSSANGTGSLDIEQLVDTGNGSRGSLDASGLIDLHEFGDLF